jgi:ribosomal protein L7Ae-like RNA K-turn-binding protein
MSPTELGRWYNANRPKPMVAGMTEDQAKMLTDMINENPEEFA